MIENIKLDIIYYRTPKDFEMEFNLCGCCRMRLLNSTADDLKALINCMKLAVARSRVIILCGEISGENNLFEIVSKAIGRETEKIENSLYGISAPGTTQLMKNSIPLISKAGVLFGCVVEQGPQSIIILSTDKQQRKDIMHDLVHPYISALSQTATIQENDSSEQAIVQEDVPQTVQDESVTQEPAVTESISENIPVGEQKQEESVQDTEDVPNLNEIEEEETLDKSDISEDSYTADMLLSLEDDEYKVDKHFDYTSDDYSLLHGSFERPVSRDRTKGRSKHSKQPEGSPLILILICILLCLVGILTYFVVLKPLMSGISISENFRQLIPFLFTR